MSFNWFRRHQKGFLWATVGFCVVVFVLFSQTGAVSRSLEGDPASVAGSFTVASSGEAREVTLEEFRRTRNSLNRLFHHPSGGLVYDETATWAHLMLLEDGLAAGLSATDAEVAQFVTGGQPITREDYDFAWRSRQFSSARELEEIVRQLLIAQRWQVYSQQAARIVDADAVFSKWSTENVRLDYEALVFADVPVEEIADPDDDELAAWWDEIPEPIRKTQYVDDIKHDIVFAWLSLDAANTAVSDEVLDTIDEPTDVQISSRFQMVKEERWPELETPDEAAKQELAREVKLTMHVQRTLSAFDLRPEEERTKDEFLAVMGAAGLTIDDPDGPLDPDELEALAPMEDPLLPLWLRQKQAGQTHYGYPMQQQASTAYAVYVEEVVEQRELSFDEAREQAVENWKKQQQSRPAQDVRDQLRDLTRALPDVAALIAPLETAAKQRVAEALEADPELDAEAQAALEQQILDEAERLEIQPRLADHEHRVWDQLVLPAHVERRSFEGISKAYSRNPDPEEASDSLDRFLKTNGNIFRLGVDTITEALRHPPSGSSVIVRVTGRTLPAVDEMALDAEGMTNARRQLASQREIDARLSFQPDRVVEQHGLQVVVWEPVEGEPDEHAGHDHENEPDV